MSQPFLSIIDAIGPFFRGYTKRRINWSKIAFPHLLTDGEKADKQWQFIEEESQCFAQQTQELGFNAVTLDDAPHLSIHPLLEENLNHRAKELRHRFKKIISIHKNHGHQVFLTSDVLWTTPRLEQHFKNNRAGLEKFFLETLENVLDSLSGIDGLILRIGESDGKDVKDDIRSKLHIRSATQLNSFLRSALPIFERRKKLLILRTWTVGSYPIGDLIWNRKRKRQIVSGIDSPSLILSLKHGASDFFRYLPANEAFFETDIPKIIEFQARREYEGAGEYPSFFGWECERIQRELSEAKNIIGTSVWCQTGGWHAFQRRPFVTQKNVPEDIWIRLNCAAVNFVFHKNQSANDAIRHLSGKEHYEATKRILELSDIAINKLYYIRPFAQQCLFFRRVRLPTILHCYWDCLFFTAQVRKLMRYFTVNHEECFKEGEAAFLVFDEMISLSHSTNLPYRDIEFMRDTFELVALARRYYFTSWSQETVDLIREKKKTYKALWPRDVRQRYRLKTDFQPFHLKRRTFRWMSALMLRKQSSYRLVDHMFTLNLLSLIYRLFHHRAQKRLPKFIKKSAMGVESVFK